MFQKSPLSNSTQSRLINIKSNGERLIQKKIVPKTCGKYYLCFSCYRDPSHKAYRNIMSVKIDKNSTNYFHDKYHGHHGSRYSPISSRNGQTGTNVQLGINRNQ